MNTRIRVLAVMGTVLALFSAYLSFQMGFHFAKFGEFAPPQDPEAYAAIMAEPISPSDIWLLAPAFLCAAGGILGLIAAVIVGKSSRSVSVMFIISSVICIFTVFGITATILFIIAAVFSFFPKTQPGDAISEKRSPAGPRKPAVTLGVIGIVLSLSVSLISAFISGYVLIPNDHVIHTRPFSFSDALDMMYLSQFVFGILGFVGGVLGISSCVALRNNAKKAGILMIFAAVLCIEVCYFIPTILFAISAVFMFRASRGQTIAEPENGPADTQ